MTVENKKKPPPYTKDEYLSANPITGEEVSLSGMRMQWMCTAETEGFNRNDPKAGFRNFFGILQCTYNVTYYNILHKLFIICNIQYVTYYL